MKNIINKLRNEYDCIFVLLSFIFFLVSISFILKDGIASTQWSLLFRRCDDFFADTFNVIGYSRDRNVYFNFDYSGLEEKPYPPLIYVFSYLLSRLLINEEYYKNNAFLNMKNEQYLLFIIFLLLGLVFVFFFYVFYRVKKGKEWIKVLFPFSLLLSRPFLFALERGNTIIITVIFVTVFLYGKDSKSPFIRHFAFISLAIATSLKITPVILGLLLLFQNRWKDSILTIIYGMFFFFAPFFVFKGGLSNVPQMICNAISNNKTYALNEDGCNFLSILFHYYGNSILKYTTIISVFSYAIGLLLIVIAYKSKTYFIKCLSLLLVMIMVPIHSGYYNILYLFPVFVMFLDSKNEEKKNILFLLSMIIINSFISIKIIDYFFGYHFALIIILLYCMSNLKYILYDDNSNHIIESIC